MGVPGGLVSIKGDDDHAACATGGENPAQAEAGSHSTTHSADQTPVQTSASAYASETAPSSTAPPSSSPTFPTPQIIEDTCLDRCIHYETIAVTHPILGPVEIRTYGRDMNPGSAPSQMQMAYAIYQDGQPLGFYEGLGNTYAFMSTNSVMGNMVWDLQNGPNIDRYGNIYLATGRSVVVLAPTDTGYSQEGTLPSAPVEKPIFEIRPFFDDAGKPVAGLHLSEDGDAYIVLGQDDDNGQVRQVGIFGTLGEDGAIAYTSCDSTEPPLRFHL